MPFGSKYGYMLAHGSKKPAFLRSPLSRFYYKIFGFPTHLGTRINARSVSRSVGKGKVILDVGCGNGIYSLEFSKENLVFGIDLSFEEIQLAKNVSERTNSNTLFLVADARRIPFKSDTFNMVLCFEVLEHISDDKRAVREMRKVLKKNGELIITVPHKDQKRFMIKKNFHELEKHHVREGYTVSSLKSILVGFDTLRAERTFRTFGSLSWEIAKISKDNWLLFPLLDLLSRMDIFSRSRGNGITMVSKRK